MNWPLTICFLTTSYSLTNALNPIILVPGYFCNALDARIAENADIDPICRPKDGGPFRLYLDLQYIATHTLKCLDQALQLFYDIKTQTTSGRKGVEVSNYLDLKYIETLDSTRIIPMFRPMIDFLEAKFGYKRNVSIFGAAFDFRKGPLEPETREFCIHYKLLIREAFVKNGGQKVILIYHSMGGIISVFCLSGYSREFKEKHISIIISLAAVYGGTTKMVDILTGVRFYGNEFAYGGEDIFSNSRRLVNGIVPAHLNDFMPKVPVETSSIEVLPGYTVQEYTGNPWLAPTVEAFGDTPIAQTQTKNYTARNLREYYKDLGGEKLAQIFDDASNYTGMLPPGEIKVYCFYGHNVPTLRTIQHEGPTPHSRKSYPINGDGDGLVNVEGANCELLKRRPRDKPVVTIPIKNINHISFFYSLDVFERIADIINEQI